MNLSIMMHDTDTTYTSFEGYCTTDCLYCNYICNESTVVLPLTSVKSTSGSDRSGYQSGSVGFDSSDIKAFASESAQNRNMQEFCSNIAFKTWAMRLLIHLSHTGGDSPKKPSTDISSTSLPHYDDRRQWYQSVSAIF